MNQRQRIVIVLPHLGVGGTERTAAVLSDYLASQGDDVTVLLMYKKKQFYTLNPIVKLIEPPDFRGRYGKALHVPFVLGFLRQEIKKLQPDVVFSLGYIAFTLLASIGLKTKVIISGRSSPSRVRFPGNPLANVAYKLTHKMLSRRVDGIVAQTKVAGTAYKNRYTCPIEVIPNFLRTMNTPRVARKNQVVTVGRCVREKGQHFLIQAFAKLNAPDWQLKIVGDGPKRTELETLADKLGIRDRVTFAGFQKDVDSNLAESKIFALTSVIEGFPNALIEAMATPLAPISFNCEAGPAEIITPGVNGFLIPVGDIEGLAGSLQRLVDDDSLRTLITNNASEAKARYDIQAIGARYKQFFLTIASTALH